MEGGMPHAAYASPIGQYLGEVLREWREARGWKRIDLQRATGVWHTTIADIEKGTSNGNNDRLDRLCIALGHDLAELFTEAVRRRDRAVAPPPRP